MYFFFGKVTRKLTPFNYNVNLFRACQNYRYFVCFLLASTELICFFVHFPSRLAEIGRFVQPKSGGKYEMGQFFLHRVFGYRGVTLFPWTAKVYDRDARKKQSAQKYAPNCEYLPNDDPPY